MVTGEVDLGSADELAAALDLIRENTAKRRILLDARAVTFMDCSGLRPILRARDHDPRLTMVAPSAPVSRLLSLVDPDGRLVPAVET